MIAKPLFKGEELDSVDTSSESPRSFWKWLISVWRGPNEQHFKSPSSGENSLRRARTKELQMSKLVSSQLSGDYASAFLGQGLSFAELRDYQPGDDPRNIHWNATARFGKPFVKVFREERQLRVVLLLDVSASMLQTPRFKEALELSSLLLSLSEKNRDQVGFGTFSSDLLSYIHPKSGRPHYRKVLYALMQPHSGGYSTDFETALRSLSEKLPKRTNLFILSDFEEPIESQQFSVVSKEHDVTCIYFPGAATEENASGLVRYIAPEVGTQCVVNASSTRAQKSIAKNEEQRWKSLKRSILSSGADIIRFSGDSLQTIHELTQARRKKRR